MLAADKDPIENVHIAGTQPAPLFAVHEPSAAADLDDATPQQITLCLQGDAQAWEDLVKASYGRVYFICYRFVGSQPEAEDLTQDVFIKVFCNLRSYDPERGTFRNWLKNVTRNHLVDRFRRTRLVRMSSSLDEVASGQPAGPTIADRLLDTRPSPEDSVITGETHARLHAALQQLPPGTRDTAMLCLIDERKQTEVAHLLGIAEGTVKSRLSRARAELAQLLRTPQLAHA